MGVVSNDEELLYVTEENSREFLSTPIDRTEAPPWCPCIRGLALYNQQIGSWSVRIDYATFQLIAPKGIKVLDRVDIERLLGEFPCAWQQLKAVDGLPHPAQRVIYPLIPAWLSEKLNQEEADHGRP